MLETYYFFITWASSYCLGRQVRVFIVLSRQNVGCVTRHFQLPSRAQGAAAQKEHKMKDVVKWEASRRKTLSKILKQFPELWGVCQSWSCDYAMQPPLPVVKTIDEVLEKEPSPGITGYWQVSGRSEINFDKRIHMDAEYVKKRSILYDLTIIAKTPWAMVSGKGAH
jgi:hypothetical protein